MASSGSRLDYNARVEAKASRTWQIKAGVSRMAGVKEKPWEKMTLAEGIEETWQILKKKQKTMDETVIHVKERVDDNISTLEAFYRSSFERTKESPGSTSKQIPVELVKEQRFDFHVDSWRCEKKELMQDPNYKTFRPEIRKCIEEINKSNKDIAAFMEDVLLDYRRMYIHNSLLGEHTVQPLEDVKLWMTSVNAEDNEENRVATGFEIERAYETAKDKLDYRKVCEDLVQQMDDMFQKVCAKELTDVMACWKSTSEKERKMQESDLPEDLAEVVQMDPTQVREEAMKMIDEFELINKETYEITFKLKEVDQSIAGTKDVYLYAVEEKLEREKILAEEAATGNVIEREILAGVLNTFEELFNNRLLKLQDAEKLLIGQMNQQSTDLDMMGKPTHSEFISDSMDASTCKQFKRCRDPQLLEKFKFVMDHLEGFKSSTKNMYMETRGAISDEVSNLLKLKIKAPTQDKHVILKTIHTLKKALEVSTNYSKVGKSIFELGVMILNEFNRLMEDKQLLTLQSADLYEDYASALYRTAWKASDNIAHQKVSAATAEKKAAEDKKTKKSARNQSIKPTGKK